MSEIDHLDVISLAVERSRAGSLLELLRPVEYLSHVDWMQKYRYLSREAADKSGKFDPFYTPYFIASYAVLDERFAKHEMCWVKPAQFGYTEFENNVLGRAIDLKLGSAMVAFPREASAIAYVDEKFIPMVEATPVLKQHFTGAKAVNKQGWAKKRYVGGYVKFNSSGSPAALKSSSVPICIQEEPDEVAENLKNQGNGIDLLRQRLKTFATSLLLVGGTPTVSGSSHVEQNYHNSKRGIYLVPCHLCGESHELSFDQLKAPQGAVDVGGAYGNWLVDEAYYECPFCGGHWSFEEKNNNVREAVKHNFYGWVFQKPDAEMWGFRGSELLSPFAGSSFKSLLGGLLEARWALRNGKDGLMISYTNNRMGLAYKPDGGFESPDGIKEQALWSYRERTVADGGLILTCGIDVQHNRFAIGVRAWGRNGNSWLVEWFELFGDVKNRGDRVWESLAFYLRKRFPHSKSSERLPLDFGLEAIAIDSGDGTLTEVIYQFVASQRACGVNIYATKGAAESEAKYEIFTLPNTGTKSYRDSVASRFGVAVYMIGTQKAKAEIYRKLNVGLKDSSGMVDRMYTPQGVREDYYTQLISNRPEYRGGKKVYVLPDGHRDEALDCEVMCLHAAKSLYLQYWSDAQWDMIEDTAVTNAQEKALGGSKVQQAEEVSVYGGHRF